MKDFLLNHYKELIAILYIVFQVVILFISLFLRSKKEPSLYSDILKSLPDLILKAEDKFGSGNGSSKLDYVLSIIDEFIFKETGVRISRSERQFFSSCIEEILKTPRKKGET